MLEESRQEWLLGGRIGGEVHKQKVVKEVESVVSLKSFHSHKSLGWRGDSWSAGSGKKCWSV